MTQGQRDINRKLRILRHGEETGNIAKTCRYFGISREIFYQWKRTYAEKGESGLINSKPCPENPKLKCSRSYSREDNLFAQELSFRCDADFMVS
jgi:transposase-like protein